MGLARQVLSGLNDVCLLLGTGVAANSENDSSGANPGIGSSMQSRSLPQLTRDQVVTRNLRGAKLIAIDNVVYDVSAFLDIHPGDALPFRRHIDSGIFPDATKAFYVIHPDGPELLAKYAHVVKPVGEVIDSAALGAEEPWPAKVVNPQSDDRPEHPDMGPGLLRKAIISATGLAWDSAGLLTSSVYWGLMRPLEVASQALFPVTGEPMRADGKPTRVAIIGAGASGLSAAWALDQTEGFDFTVFEKQARVGGHAHTVKVDLRPDVDDIDDSGMQVPVDMGFIFGNERSYSNLLELMANVGAKPVPTELSVAADVKGHKWCTSAKICKGMEGALQMHPAAEAECRRFHEVCTKFSENPALNLFPFDKFLDMMGFSVEWREIYLSPLLNILFLDTKTMYKTSARFLCNIFGGKNKFMDLLDGQEAFTVEGGTRDTWERVRRCFPERVRTGCGVNFVKRQPKGTVPGETSDTVLVALDDGTEAVFDHVIMAVNGRAAGLLLDRGQTMSALERLFFSQVRYNTECAFLHTDSSFLPQDVAMTRNFNYVQTADMDHPQLTGSMLHVGNRDEAALAPNARAVSNTKDAIQVPILTTSPSRQISKEDIIKEWWGSLHVQDLRHLVLTRGLLPMLQGNCNIWFGASWANWMGHSGAVDAGMCCAVRIGANYPLTNKLSRTEFFNDCAQDMFGPRFNWRKSVRKYKPGRDPASRAAAAAEAEKQRQQQKELQRSPRLLQQDTQQPPLLRASL